MRGYLIFCVFFYHARLGPYDGMYLMLPLFFVLSGFLITALLLDDRDRAGRIDYRRFIVRRVRRLAPAAFGGVLLAVIYGATVATKSQAFRRSPPRNSRPTPSLPRWRTVVHSSFVASSIRPAPRACVRSSTRRSSAQPASATTGKLTSSPS
jgi:peptidoglycan/LPS O-acetylase OafA/YrhL